MKTSTSNKDKMKQEDRGIKCYSKFDRYQIKEKYKYRGNSKGVKEVLK
jgi:hypothetical protein